MLLALLTTLGIGVRIVSVALGRRGPVPRSHARQCPQRGTSPSDSATTEHRRHTWQIVGCRASGELVADVADALAHGKPLPPGRRDAADTGVAPRPRPHRLTPVSGPDPGAWHPAGMVELLTGGAGETPVHDAATVVLAHDGDAGLECLMLRKTKGQAFGGCRSSPVAGSRTATAPGSTARGPRRSARPRRRRASSSPRPTWCPSPTGTLRPRRPAATPRGSSSAGSPRGRPTSSSTAARSATTCGRHRPRRSSATPRVRSSCCRHLGQPPTHRRPARRGDGAGRCLRRPGRPLQHPHRRPRRRLVSLWDPDAAYDTGDLAAPGPRHRLVMDPAGWRYERSD